MLEFRAVSDVDVSLQDGLDEQISIIRAGNIDGELL